MTQITVPLGVVMSRSAAVTGAAPAWIGDRVHQSPHRGRVLHVGVDAVYFTSHADVLGITSRHATAIPCTIATRLETVHELFGIDRPARVGDDVTIGSGSVRLGDTEVRIGRFVDYRMHRLPSADVTSMRGHLLATTGESSQSAEIQPAVLELLRTTPADALPSVLGLGSGLTPFGDDVVCGMLATLLANDDACAPGLRDEVLRLAPHRTTALSATLLRRAADGDVLPAFADLVRALHDDPDHVSTSIAQLLSIGHTSGAGMMLGLRIALDHIITRSCCP